MTSNSKRKDNFSKEELIRLHFCHMKGFAEDLVNALKLKERLDKKETEDRVDC